MNTVSYNTVRYVNLKRFIVITFINVWLVNIVFLGPSEWYKDYPIAEGNRQSPIDIVPADAVFDARLSPISLSYNNCTSVSISNNGHSVVVEFIDSDERSGWYQWHNINAAVKWYCHGWFIGLLMFRNRQHLVLFLHIWVFAHN